MTVPGKTSAERTAYRLRYANKRRLALLVKIAEPGLRDGEGLCAQCKNSFPLSGLFVDHIDGITWNRLKLSPQMRYAKYHRELEAGVKMRALCSSCSGRDGAYRRGTRRY